MGERKYYSSCKKKEKTKGEKVMAKLNFNSDNASLFETIIKIVRKHDGNYVADQDDFVTTKLIMKEVEKWQSGATKILDKMKQVKFQDARITTSDGSLDAAFSFFLANLAEEVDRQVMGGGELIEK